jgi:hypothetical protein
VDFFFFARKWRGDGTICEPHRCDDLQWFPVDALPDTMIAHERRAFELYQQGIFYSEFGWS